MLDRSQSVDEKLTKWLDPIVNVLCALSDTIGNAVGLVTTPKFKPARDLLSDVCDSGIPTCDHNIFRDRSPSTSECRPWHKLRILPTDIPIRPLRMSEIVDGLSSIFLAESNPFLRGSKYIQMDVRRFHRA